MSEKKFTVVGDGYIGSAFRIAGMNSVGKDKFVYTGRNFDDLIPHIKDANVVINALGITNTKWTEEPGHFRQTWMVNANFVKELSDYCEKEYKKLVQLSTGDLYGNEFSFLENVESSTRIDIGTNYRFSKYGGERFCNDDDLILRIRLPFDDRNHPKNLLVKAYNYTKFYSYVNDYTYLPDLINATRTLVDQNQTGIFNVVSHEDSCILYLFKNILGLEKFQHIDIHNENDPNMIYELNNIHVHNVSNDSKLRQFFIQTPMEIAVKTCWENLKNLLPPKDSVIS